MACRHLGRPAPAKVTKTALERGRKELLAVPGIGEATVEKLYLAGIYDAATLREADPGEVSSITGIAKARIHDYISHLK